MRELNHCVSDKDSLGFRVAKTFASTSMNVPSTMLAGLCDSQLSRKCTIFSRLQPSELRQARSLSDFLKIIPLNSQSGTPFAF